MKSISEAVESFLQQELVWYTPTDKVGVFRSGFRNENGSFTSYVEACDTEGTVRVCTVAPVRVPRSQIARVAELVARINEHLLFGHFGLGIDLGMVVCETGIMLGDSDLHPDVMQHLLFANWWAMDLYFPAVRMVVRRKVTPQQAIDVVERGLETPDEAATREPLGRRLSDILRGSMN